MINQGDVILAQRGTLGKSAIINKNIEPATINSSLILLNKTRYSLEHLVYFLKSKSILDFINQSNGRTSIPMISQNQIESFKIRIPETSKQTRIASALTMHR